jgi:hypothetical protein
MKAKEAEKLVKKFIEKWKHIVTHYGWKFHVYYLEDHAGFPGGTRGATTSAVVYPNFKQLEANIYFNLENLASEDEEYIEETVVHELTHMLISPLQVDADLEETLVEYTVTTIARALKGMGKEKQP